MKTNNFSSSDQISIILFLSAFKLAFDTNGIHEGAAIWQLPFFMKSRMLQFKLLNCPLVNGVPIPQGEDADQLELRDKLPSANLIPHTPLSPNWMPNYYDHTVFKYDVNEVCRGSIEQPALLRPRLR